MARPSLPDLKPSHLCPKHPLPKALDALSIDLFACLLAVLRCTLPSFCSRRPIAAQDHTHSPTLTLTRQYILHSSTGTSILHTYIHTPSLRLAVVAGPDPDTARPHPHSLAPIHRTHHRQYMPSSHSATSTSFAKMENGGYGQRSSGFSFGRIVGDPFALATISIGIVSRSCPSATAAPSFANLCHSLPGSSPLSAP